jgi:hypothetical protein
VRLGEALLLVEDAQKGLDATYFAAGVCGRFTVGVG